MAIRDDIQPKQVVECDLCGKLFERSLKRESHSFDGPWEPVSILVYPHVPSDVSKSHMGSIYIDHACLDCRKVFADAVQKLIADWE